ncbi:MAG: AraC family transcriptional regulator [Gammaproteobacteria bacterium]|nr:AraC family transcriptional regulator [Gammaproteobacteria bacterium]
MTASTPLQGVVPVTYVNLLYEYLGKQGINADELLGPAPIAEHGIGRYPVTEWKALLETAASAIDDPLLSLHIGSTISPKHLGVLGYVLLACGTLGGALQRMEQYHQLIYDVNPMRIELGQDCIELVWGQAMGRPGALVDETGVAALVHFCRDIVDQPNYNPIRVDFINAKPSNLADYEAWFGCPVSFERKETRVAVHPSALAIPLRSADTALIHILQQQADALLAELPQQDKAHCMAVRKHITEQLREGEPSAETTAEAMFITSRTLHRKLAAEGSSFRELLQETRQQLAQDYLRDRRLQLSEITQLLGYSEQSALSRAFKGWTGLTPAQYRKQAYVT